MAPGAGKEFAPLQFKITTYPCLLDQLDQVRRGSVAASIVWWGCWKEEAALAWLAGLTLCYSLLPDAPER